MTRGPAWLAHSEQRCDLRSNQDFPRSGSTESSDDGICRVLLDRFPFGLVYRVGTDEINVLAVMKRPRRRPLDTERQSYRNARSPQRYEPQYRNES